MTTIETPAITEQRLALLSVMLPYHINRYQRFLKALERRGTPQSLEAADYVRKELETARKWHTEIKERK